MHGKYLITTDNWFFAPDGRQYRCAWGHVEVFEDNQTLGIKSNRNSTNWYCKVGTGDKHIIIAGCQIHYAVRCESKPNTEDIPDYDGTSRKTQIYIAE